MTPSVPLLSLYVVRQDSEWNDYHAIRQLVLYELRGRTDYDPDHPDEHREDHIPLLFKLGAEAVGTARLDLKKDMIGVGFVRLVAVMPMFQRRGIGSAMMRDLEAFAAENGVTQLRVHSAPDAVTFYRKLGWRLVDDGRRTPLLMKRIGGA